MLSRCSGFLIVICLSLPLLAWGQLIQPAPPENPRNSSPTPEGVVPKNTIIVKGAWASASDSTTPVPEGGSVANNLFTDRYFGITYSLPPEWAQRFTPRPPSDTGSYVLAEISRPDTYKGEARGSILFSAQDMFFTPMPAATARQVVNYSRKHLPDYYQVEMKPTQTTIGGQPFTFFAYWAPVGELHWYVMATEVRCHTIEIVLMNRDTKILQDLFLDMNKRLKFSAEATSGGNVPVCIKDYASGDNVIERVDPVFPERRFNPVPVRIIIDKEGKIKHIHFLSAFPDQQKAISDALKHWKFRPYERDGQRLEVETGIMFGRPSAPVAPPPGADAISE